MQTAPYRLLLFLLIIPFTIVGCGYHSPYKKSIGEKGEKKAIFLSVWKNNTNELGFEGQIQQRIADWLQESKHITLTTKRDEADLLLSGSIDSIDFPATAFSVTDRAGTIKARVKTSYQLTRRKSGEKVKQTQNTIREVSYSSSNDSVRTQSNKNDALERIAAEIGEQIYLEVFYELTGYKK